MMTGTQTARLPVRSARSTTRTLNLDGSKSWMQKRQPFLLCANGQASCSRSSPFARPNIRRQRRATADKFRHGFRDEDENRLRNGFPLPLSFQSLIN